MARPKEKTPEEIKDEKAKKAVGGKNQWSSIKWLTPGAGWQINFKGVYSHEFFYKTMYTYLLERNYFAVGANDSEGSTTGEDKYETMYDDRNNAGYHEVWYEWRAKKIKFDEQCDWYIFFRCHMLGLSSKEVMHNGQKVQLDSVELDSWLRGGIHWHNYAKKAPQFVQDVIGPNGEKLYKKYYASERDKIEEDFYDELVELFDHMKSILGLPMQRDNRQFTFDRRGLPMTSTESPSWQPNPDT